MKIKVAVVDDHILISKILADYINTNDTYQVMFTANNGKELLQYLGEREEHPSIILLDIHMPVMNGFQSMIKLNELYPDINVVILSMEDEESSIIQFLHLGAKGYLLKGMSSPEIIINCFDEILKHGFYYPKYITPEMIRAGKQDDLDGKWELTDRQVEFLKLATQTAMTYQEIADEMFLSIKTVENYQRELFKKFKVKNRPALMLFVQQHNIIGFKKH